MITFLRISSAALPIFSRKTNAFPLSILVSFSFELGCFPNCLKTAKVIPLYKSGDKTLATNYRPISLLTCFSKILEKLIFTRLTNFFDQNSVISPTQYGFRKNHSTSHAVLDVVTTTYDNINDNKHFGTGRLAQLLSARYRCGRSGVRFLGRSNRHSVANRLSTAGIFLRSCVAQALSRGDGPRHSPQPHFGVIRRV